MLSKKNNFNIKRFSIYTKNAECFASLVLSHILTNCSFEQPISFKNDDNNASTLEQQKN